MTEYPDTSAIEWETTGLRDALGAILGRLDTIAQRLASAERMAREARDAANAAEQAARRASQRVGGW